MSTLSPTSPLLSGLCDDAAVFPPGNMLLEQAVPAHVRHRQSAYADLVGRLVLAAKDLGRLADVVAGLPAGLATDLGTVPFELAVTVPLPHVAVAVAVAGRIPAVRLAVLEVALPEQTRPDDLVPALDHALEGIGVPVFVEVPRDERRDEMLRALTSTPYLAKFRTGGVCADLYPDEGELAGSVLAAVRARVPFKATAGLHHALRNTDQATGFEQHGFLNLLAATAAALKGGDQAELVAVLAERDGSRVAERVRALSPQVREAFRSFGTCSIAEPVAELAALGLLDPDLTEDLS
jgi:hypothetical protein